MGGWAPFTFLRLAFFLVAGILTYIHYPGIFHESLYLVAGAICLLIYLSIWLWRGTRTPVSAVLLKRNHLPEGLLTFCITFLFGSLLTHYANDAARNDHILHQPHFEYYQAIVHAEVQAQPPYLRTELLVRAIRDSAGWRPAYGKILASVEMSEEGETLHYGDVLLIKGKPSALKPPSNPGEFDYRQLMSYRQLFHQHFIRNHAYTLIGGAPPVSVRSWALYARQGGRQVLIDALGSTRAYAIAAALVLGIKEGLDVELRNAYASAGAMHVLAVSGLHVGVIFWILRKVFGPLQKRKWGNWIFLLVVLSVLWSYAFITGLSASVLRAVIMFSIVSVAQAFQRRSNIYNTLAVAAFIMLCFNPYLIMSVGFQLSFAAVAGIVYLYPRLNRWLTFRTKVATYFWQISCVSVAAQLATFPLGIYYFHQFPMYFWLANLVVIPVALAILVGGLMLIGLSFTGVDIGVPATLLAKLIEGLNYVVVQVESLPSATLEGLMLSTAQTIAIYFFMVLLLLFFDQKTYSALKLAVAALAFIIISLGLRYWEQGRQQQFVVYNIRNHSAMALHEGRQLALLADSALLQQPARIRFFLQQDWWQRGVNEVVRADLRAPTLPLAVQRFEHMGVTVWKGQTIIWLDKPLRNVAPGAGTETDVLIIQQNAIRSLAELQGRFRFKTLVIDSSNKAYLANALSREAQEAGIEVHNVATQGAYIVSM
jgi:competence protein ComEC